MKKKKQNSRKFTSTCISKNIDGNNDKFILDESFEAKNIPVTFNFNKDKLLGHASLKVDNEELVAYIDFAKGESKTVELVGQIIDNNQIKLYSVIGGNFSHSDAEVKESGVKEIKKFNITSIGVTANPSDKNLKPLSEIK